MSLLNVSISIFLENGHFLSSLPSSQTERGEKTSAVTDPFHRMERKILEKNLSDQVVNLSQHFLH